MLTCQAYAFRRRRISALRLLMLLSFLGLTSPLYAQRLSVRTLNASSGPIHGEHCLGEAKQKVLLNQYLAGSINPLGIGQQLRLSLCTPLITKPGLLFDLTNIDTGILLLNTPTNLSFGGFVNIVPLSFLVLRAEADVFYIWPTPLQGAGFITLDSRKNEFTLNALSPSPFGPDPARTATGGRIMLGTTLRGEVPIGSRLAITVADGFNGEYWRVTDSTWADAQHLGDNLFYVARRDVVLHGPGDWLIMNTAALLLSIKARRNITVRIGPTDDLVYVPSLQYLGNIAAGIIVLSAKDFFNLAKDFSFFLRAGAFTHHAFRVGSGVTFALGFDLTYELFKRPVRRPVAPEEPLVPEPSTPSEPVQPTPPTAPVDVPPPSTPTPAEPAATPTQTT